MSDTTTVSVDIDADGMIEAIKQRLQLVAGHAKTAAADAMNESFQEAKALEVELVEAAITPTGLKRMQGHVDFDARRENAIQRKHMKNPHIVDEHKSDGGHPGRIETGGYIDEFNHQVYPVGDEGVQGRLGWIDKQSAPSMNGGSDHADGVSYFWLQDHGFQARGKTVEGVHALQQAFNLAKELFKKKLTAFRDRNYA